MSIHRDILAEAHKLATPEGDTMAEQPTPDTFEATVSVQITDGEQCKIATLEIDRDGPAPMLQIAEGLHGIAAYLENEYKG